jgi:hypothetical protein
MASAMRMFKAGMAVSDGSWALSSSRSAIRSLAEFGRPGTNSFLKPVGMLCLDAVQRISLKACSPLAQEVGGGWMEKRSSVSRMKPAQLANLKFVKERLWGDGYQRGRKW